MIFYCVFLIIFDKVLNQPLGEVNICGKTNNARLFLQYNTSIKLIAENTSIVNNNFNSNSTFSLCSVEFVTCPSCRLQLKFSLINISNACDKNVATDSCNCDLVWVYETQYEKFSGEQYCGRYIKNENSDISYLSKTRNLKITFIYSKDYRLAFTAECTSLRNSKTINGYPTYSNKNNISTQWITSPFFPNHYPLDLSNEYIIQCHSRDICRISLTFSDYEISSDSIMEFFDTNGQRIFVSTGNIFRPPTILSSGPLLTLRFYANGHTSLGFKASFTFHLGENTINQPSMDCGGWVSDLGGGISMINVTKEKSKLYDCLYIIKPSLNFFHMKTHLFLKVLEFSDFADNAELMIRQGSTSEDPLIQTLKHPISQFIGSQKEQIAPISTGFYLHFKGILTYKSKLVIVYSAFNYKDCFSGTDFLCRNLRCISVLLTCDGFDHCGDNSDEENNCISGNKNRQQWSKIPHFIFPPVSNYSDLTAATLIFLSCSFGFVGLIFGMAIYFYRSNIQAQTRMQIQEHLDTIHAILSEDQIDIEEELIIPDDPPIYEDPPNYEEVIKKISPTIKKSESNQMYANSNSNKTFTVLNKRPQLTISPNRTDRRVVIPESPPPLYTSNEMVLGSLSDQKKKSSVQNKEKRIRKISSNRHNATTSTFNFFQTSIDSIASQDVKKALSESRLCPFSMENEEDSGSSTDRCLWYCKRSFSYDDILHLLKCD